MLRGQEARSLVACFFFGHRPLSLTALSGSLRSVGCLRRAKQTPSHCGRWATLQCVPCFFLRNAIYIRQTHNGKSSATSISSCITGPMYLIVISQKETFFKTLFLVFWFFFTRHAKFEDNASIFDLHWSRLKTPCSLPLVCVHLVWTGSKLHTFIGLHISQIWPPREHSPYHPHTIESIYHLADASFFLSEQKRLTVLALLPPLIGVDKHQKLLYKWESVMRTWAEKVLPAQQQSQTKCQRKC